MPSQQRRFPAQGALLQLEHGSSDFRAPRPRPPHSARRQGTTRLPVLVMREGHADGVNAAICLGLPARLSTRQRPQDIVEEPDDEVAAMARCDGIGAVALESPVDDTAACDVLVAQSEAAVVSGTLGAAERQGCL
jgi:hypothetical protein